MTETFTCGGAPLSSRLLLGTARYPSPETLRESVIASGTEVITVSLRRETAHGSVVGRFADFLKSLPVHILPNTAGCRSAREAIATAQMAREIFDTSWIKLEVIGDDYTLQPDPFGLVEAAEALIGDGFDVFPYMTTDLVVAERLVHLGCRILMPWGAPIGSGRGLVDEEALKALRQRFSEQILVIDAGIGKPSHAARAMELGYDAVLLNTAVAQAANPKAMAQAFAQATSAGRTAYLAGMIEPKMHAEASSPIVGQPFRRSES